MPKTTDPTLAIKQAAAAMPGAVVGTSCNQTSFKFGKKAFLYIGPGAKGIGYKAMFKLSTSIEDVRALAADEPGRYQVGSNGWVTTRFSAEKPLLKKFWSRWLKESAKVAAG